MGKSVTKGKKKLLKYKKFNNPQNTGCGWVPGCLGGANTIERYMSYERNMHPY